MGADGLAVLRKTFFWPDSGTIIEFDDRGRVIRIPGVYPVRESRLRPLLLVLAGVAVFVLMGLLAAHFMEV